MDDRRTKPSPLQIKTDCILLGGFASTIEDFAPLLAALKPQEPLLLLLPPGDFDQVVETLLDFIKEAVDQPVPLIGYSMGGRIAFQLALRSPEYFSQLICLSTRLYPPKERSLFEGEVERRLSTEKLDDFFSWWYQLPIFAGYTPSNKLLSAKKKLGKKALLDQFQQLKITRLPPLILHQLPATHLIYGTNDPLCKETEDCIKQSGAPIFVHKVPSSGHLVHLEQPNALAQLLQRIFL